MATFRNIKWCNKNIQTNHAARINVFFLRNCHTSKHQMRAKAPKHETALFESTLFGETATSRNTKRRQRHPNTKPRRPSQRLLGEIATFRNTKHETAPPESTLFVEVAAFRSIKWRKRHPNTKPLRPSQRCLTEMQHFETPNGSKKASKHETAPPESTFA